MERFMSLMIKRMKLKQMLCLLLSFVLLAGMLASCDETGDAEVSNDDISNDDISNDDISNDDIMDISEFDEETQEKMRAIIYKSYFQIGTSGVGEPPLAFKNANRLLPYVCVDEDGFDLEPQKGDTFTCYGETYTVEGRCYLLQYEMSPRLVLQTEARDKNGELVEIKRYHNDAPPMMLYYKERETRDRNTDRETGKIVALEYIETVLNGKYGLNIDIEKYELLALDQHPYDSDLFIWYYTVNGFIMRKLSVSVNADNEVFGFTCTPLPDEKLIDEYLTLPDEAYKTCAYSVLKAQFGEEADIKIKVFFKQKYEYHGLLHCDALYFYIYYSVTYPGGEEIVSNGDMIIPFEDR